MFQVFEYLFYFGVFLIAISALMILYAIVRRKGRPAIFAGILFLAGASVIAGPAIYSRTVMDVDLGAREKIVNGDVHIGLTGWDGESYAFLQNRPETIRLQMANADVDDDVLKNIEGMSKLKELDLNDSKVSDAGLKLISQLTTIETLRLRGTLITDVGFQEFLAKMPNLKQLDLRQTNISGELVDQWKNTGEGRRVLRQ